MKTHRLCVVALGAAMMLSILTAPMQSSTRTHHQQNKDVAHEIAEQLRERGYSEDNPVILACQEWWQDEHEKEQYAPSYATSAQAQEYPVASYVWQRLRDAGFSEAVSAGIIGNMMAECGGHTLSLQAQVSVGGYYGLCMWYVSYTPQISGQDVAGQVDVLLDTIEHNVTEAGCDWQKFLDQTDAGNAAMLFCLYYERCQWHTVRSDNAVAALEYFTGGDVVE